MQIQNIGIYDILIFPYRFTVIMSTALQNAPGLADGFRRKEYNLNLAVKDSQIFLRQISTSFLIKNQYDNINVEA